MKDLKTKLRSELPRSIETIEDEQSICIGERAERFGTLLESKRLKKEALINNGMSKDGINVQKDLNMSSRCVRENELESW